MLINCIICLLAAIALLAFVSEAVLFRGSKKRNTKTQEQYNYFDQYHDTRNTREYIRQLLLQFPNKGQSDINTIRNEITRLQETRQLGLIKPIKSRFDAYKPALDWSANSINKLVFYDEVNQLKNQYGSQGMLSKKLERMRQRRSRECEPDMGILCKRSKGGEKIRGDTKLADDLIEKINIAIKFSSYHGLPVEYMKSLEALRTYVQYLTVEKLLNDYHLLDAYLRVSQLRGSRRVVPGVAMSEIHEIEEDIWNKIEHKLYSIDPVGELLNLSEIELETDEDVRRLFEYIDSQTTEEKIASYDAKNEPNIAKIKQVILSGYARHFQKELAETHNYIPAHLRKYDLEKLAAQFKDRFGFAYNETS